MQSIIFETEDKVIRVIDLNKEYNGNNEEIPFAIVTDLSEAALKSEHHDVIEQFCPYVIITSKMYEAMRESFLNDHRERMRDTYLHDAYSLEAAICMIDEFSNPVRICESLYTMDCLFERMRTLPNGAGSNIYKKYVIGYSIAEIAKMKGVEYQEVQKSIYRSLSELHDIFAELGVAA